MASQNKIAIAVALILAGGSLGDFEQCFTEDSDQVITGIYHNALVNPELKAKVVELGVWQSWEDTILQADRVS